MKRLLLLLATVAILCAQVTIGNGTKTVTTAGTAVALTTSTNNTVVRWVTIQALTSNTGTICVGSSTVLVASKNGTCITAGQAAPMYEGTVRYDLSTVYIDSGVNGEGVSYTYAR